MAAEQKKYLDLTGLSVLVSNVLTKVNAKANASHTHTISNITNLQSSLDGKSNTGHTHSAATTSANGFMTSAMVTKLNGISANANNYTLPVASSSAIGGVKSGTDIAVDSSGNVSVNNDSHTHSASTITSVNASAITGVLSSSQLPSYVDDVLEYAGSSKFPSSGESGKIYVDTSTNKIYRWSGSTYVVISDTIALGETSSTAYRGDRGAIAYNHSQTTGNPHGTTIANISGLQTALDQKSNSSHTHSYAGSSTAGGAATSANKLNTNAGSATKPVFFTNGVPSACTYELNKTVPSDAKFTDTTYSSATTSASGLMTSAMVAKLNGIAEGAEANQNAFSTVKVGNTNLVADAKSDTLTITAGSNITLTPNETSDSFTIAAAGYTHPSSGVTAGTYRSVTVNAQGHVTAGANPTTVSGYGLTDVYTKSQIDGYSLITASDIDDICGQNIISANELEF